MKFLIECSELRVLNTALKCARWKTSFAPTFKRPVCASGPLNTLFREAVFIYMVASLALYVGKEYLVRRLLSLK